MLLLGFNIGDEKYVIDTYDVIEVTPLVRLKTIPRSLPGISGLFNYHGKSVPVIDLNILCGQLNSVDTLTTRIILVNYEKKNILGIKAKNVTETLRINESEFKDSEIQIHENKFLGKVTEYKSSFLQLINVKQLLTPDVRNCLFPNESEATE